MMQRSHTERLRWNSLRSLRSDLQQKGVVGEVSQSKNEHYGMSGEPKMENVKSSPSYSCVKGESKFPLSLQPVGARPAFAFSLLPVFRKLSLSC
jgi:hypothetical protein